MYLVVMFMPHCQGLITGRTSAFLLDPKSADIHSKQNIATTQSHEVAHMWYLYITSYPTGHSIEAENVL